MPGVNWPPDDLTGPIWSPPATGGTGRAGSLARWAARAGAGTGTHRPRAAAIAVLETACTGGRRTWYAVTAMGPSESGVAAIDGTAERTVTRVLSGLPLTVLRPAWFRDAV